MRADADIDCRERGNADIEINRNEYAGANRNVHHREVGNADHYPTTPLDKLSGSFVASDAFDAAAAFIQLPDSEFVTTAAMSLDLNADGLLDVLVAVIDGATRSVWSLIQSSIDVWQPAVSVANLGSPRALSDLDGDGYLDLLLSDPLGVVRGGPKGIDLQRVEALPGVMGFANFSIEAGITPMDLDGDRLTDLAVGAFGAEDRILYQEADGSFVERRLDPGLTFALCPADFDGDGRFDLISMMDGLFEEVANEGGAWQQQGMRDWLRGAPAGWPVDSYLAPSLFGKGTPMGCAWGELDGDRELELVLTQINSGTPIYDRQGDTWQDVGRLLPGVKGYPENSVQGLEVFWGVATVDFDGDGRDDMAIAGGGPVGELGQYGVSHIGLFIQQDSGFEERGKELGFDQAGDFQSVIADDLDADGRPDLLIGAFRGRPRLFLNRLERRGGMLVMEFRGRAVEGVQVEILGSETSWTMWPGSQIQPYTGARPVLFRGVGNEQELRLRIHWPGDVRELPVVPRAQPWVIEAPPA